MPYQTLEDLRAHIEDAGKYPPGYHDKMVHDIPKAHSVDRVQWLVARCKGQSVLHLGSEGPLHALLEPVCSALYGVDHVEKRAPNYHCVDLDWCADELLGILGVELVLAPEVLEHLCNPGFLLRMVQTLYPQCPLVVTIPSAFAPQPMLGQWKEIINSDHTSWGSPHATRRLLEKCGYAVTEMYFYGKPAPPQSEGLIFVCQRSNG